MIQALDFYEPITVYEKDGMIFTDGSKRAHLPQTGKQLIFHQLETQWNRVRQALTTKTTFLSPKPNKQTYYRIAPSIHDRHLDALRSELNDLHPTLQRNLGIITKISNLELLAQSI